MFWPRKRHPGGTQRQSWKEPSWRWSFWEKQGWRQSPEAGRKWPSWRSPARDLLGPHSAKEDPLPKPLSISSPSFVSFKMLITNHDSHKYVILLGSPRPRVSSLRPGPGPSSGPYPLHRVQHWHQQALSSKYSLGRGHMSEKDQRGGGRTGGGGWAGEEWLCQPFLRLSAKKQAKLCRHMPFHPHVPRRGSCSSPSFIHEEIEAQREHKTCPMSHSLEPVEMGLELESAPRDHVRG